MRSNRKVMSAIETGLEKPVNYIINIHNYIRVSQRNFYTLYVPTLTLLSNNENLCKEYGEYPLQDGCKMRAGKNGTSFQHS